MPLKNYLSLLVLIPAIAFATDFDCVKLDLQPVLESTYARTPTDDFSFRDSLAQTEVPREDWQLPQYGSWGPCPLTFPRVLADPTRNAPNWSRVRIVEVAKKYIGLPYKHRHIPAMGGLDCSNFTSWVYNYGFGIRFTSNIRKQAAEAGRRLVAGESLVPGDLIFLYDSNHVEIIHVAIYIDEHNIIDSTGEGIKIRSFSGRYKNDVAWVRRVIE
ncbi:MAG: NlpC/P60 family protein [Bdellovibrionota bacterium]